VSNSELPPAGYVERGPRPTSDLGGGHFLLRALGPAVVELSADEERDSLYAGYVLDDDGVYRKPLGENHSGNRT
jgi:hypothetical protein